jgi:predicted RNA-binding protein
MSINERSRDVTDTGYWVIVGSPENFATTREHGFTIQGMKSRHRKKAEQMKPGDKIVYYVTGLKAFAGVATITSDYFEDHTIIWRSTNKKRQDEDYPYRVTIEQDIILDDGEFISAEPIARGMKYVQKWPAENWTLAFQGNVHRIDEDDFTLIHDAIKQAAGAPATR